MRNKTVSLCLSNEMLDEVEALRDKMREVNPQVEHTNDDAAWPIFVMGMQKYKERHGLVQESSKNSTR